MLRNKRESIEWLEFEIFQEFPQIGHAIFLRHGGVSAAPYLGLNVGGGTGDNPQHIQQNRTLLLKLMGCKAFAGSYQVHGADVRQAPLENPDEKCDGLYTAKEGLGLFIKHADCQAAIVYDPVQNVIANIHAGWRGNVLNIYQSAALELKNCFGSKPENLIVGISPSLGPCCAQFVNYKIELPEHFLEFQVKPLYFDLWEVARRQWMNAGVLPHHLQIAKICTCCNKEDYFSYRRDKPTGRHATVILKRPSC
jgi:YfiH family protein